MAITGTPQYRASISTDGSPSHRDERTKAADRTMYGYGLVTHPGSPTSASRPSSPTSDWRCARSGPPPRINRRASCRARTWAKARIRVGKSFCGASLPTARNTGGSPGSNQAWPIGLAAILRSSGVTIGL